MSNDAKYDDLFSSLHRGIIVAIKPDGRPHLSNVSHVYDPQTRVLRVSLTDGRAKTRYLRKDPRASYHVTSSDFWQWGVAEGSVTLSEVAAAPDDAAVEELIEVYRAVAGEHSDWDDYRRAMVADRRLVFRLQVERFYGQVQ